MSCDYARRLFFLLAFLRFRLRMRFRRRLRRFCARLSLDVSRAVRLARRAHEVIRLTRLAGLARRMRSGAARLTGLSGLSPALRSVLSRKLARLSRRVLRAVLLPKLSRLSTVLCGARRHARAVRAHHARRIECRGSRGCRNRRMAAVGSGVQRGISESLLHVLVLQAGRRYMPF
jgi:hypothetical protein